jgi:ABC-type multidrug transport system ATPase subunit
MKREWCVYVIILDGGVLTAEGDVEQVREQLAGERGEGQHVDYPQGEG